MSQLPQLTLNQAKHILAALRAQGDTLAECILDPALTSEARNEFEADSREVELLISKYRVYIAEEQE